MKPGRITTGELEMFVLFETKERRTKDRQEVVALFRKYGDETLDILRTRVNDKNLSSRDRKHWKRILSKAKIYRRHNDDGSFAQKA